MLRRSFLGSAGRAACVASLMLCTPTLIAAAEPATVGVPEFGSPAWMEFRKRTRTFTREVLANLRGHLTGASGERGGFRLVGCRYVADHDGVVNLWADEGAFVTCHTHTGGVNRKACFPLARGFQRRAPNMSALRFV